MIDEEKRKLGKVVGEIEEQLYVEGNWDTTIAQYVSEKLAYENMPKIEWTEDGLSTLVYLYDLEGSEMNEQDWANWALLYTKWYAYDVQENLSAGSVYP